MRKIKDPDVLLDLWGKLAVASRKFETSLGEQERVGSALELAAIVSMLRGEFRDELGDAIRVVAEEAAAIGADRRSGIKQYHHQRVDTISSQLEVLDQKRSDSENRLTRAESTSKRKHLEYELKDHQRRLEKTRATFSMGSMLPKRSS